MYFSTMHTPNFLFRWQDFPSFHCNCSQWAFFTMLGHNFSLVDKTFHNAHSQHLSFSWQNFLSFRSYCSQGHHTGPLSAPLCSFCRLEGNTWHTSTGSTGCFKYKYLFQIQIQIQNWRWSPLQPKFHRIVCQNGGRSWSSRGDRHHRGSCALFHGECHFFWYRWRK